MKLSDQNNDCLNLLKTPPQERNEQWNADFLSKVGEAKFISADPQVVYGGDDNPYFQYFTPTSDKAAHLFSIDAMNEDYLLKNGFGVVINPTDKGADWMFTYGELLNYHLNGEFYTISNEFRSKTGGGEQTLTQDEAIKVKAIPEAILPKMSCKVLKEFLIENGIAVPKALLMMRNGTLDIVFNFLPQQFESKEHYQYVAQTIAWFLPRHYSFVSVDEATFANSFVAL